MKTFLKLRMGVLSGVACFMAIAAANSALAWEQVAGCQNGDLVVDWEWYQARGGQWFRRIQLVLRNPAAIQHLVSQGAFGDLNDHRRTGIEINERGELIVPTGDLSVPTSEGRFYWVTTWRFNEEEYRRDGFGFILLDLKDEGNGNYRVSAFKANAYPSARPLVADWLFRGCWRKI